MSTIVPGAPALIDLQTPDEDASVQFYSALFGWKLDEQNPSGYRYARAEGGSVIAGVRAAYGDAAPAWMLYLATNDIAATARRAAVDGGSVLHGPVAVPGQGSVMIITDPTGAATGIWQPEPSFEFASLAPGSLAWAELLTADGKSADNFYTSLLGVSVTQIGDGEHYDYTIWNPAKQQAPIGGRLHTELPSGVPAHWRIYLAVDPAIGTDRTVEAATALGAAVIAEPNEIPAGRIAVLADPIGAQFALLTPAPRDRRSARV
ncbi:VOC family protein [Dietzia timorensis]|uniref:27 kDa antigen Cfp30B n=1 Tax=Dietzia timorensis TaxID=499555 RepID=A0A173LH51_9ACTN|nr:VOC family protein [Dietzia timorensis]ANI90868.1 27 kDa antigen Cfp30B [Dietzia timorensis]